MSYNCLWLSFFFEIVCALKRDKHLEKAPITILKFWQEFFKALFLFYASHQKMRPSTSRFSAKLNSNFSFPANFWRASQPHRQAVAGGKARRYTQATSTLMTCTRACAIQAGLHSACAWNVCYVPLRYVYVAVRRYFSVEATKLLKVEAGEMFRLRGSFLQCCQIWRLEQIWLISR